MVECEASTFPLVNLTKVSTAAHSTQYSGLQLFHGKKVTFWCLSFFNSKYLVALSRAGLVFNPALPIFQVQLEVGTHPVTVGFSTVWPSLTTEVPRALAQAIVHCRIYEMPLHGSFIPCCFLA